MTEASTQRPEKSRGRKRDSERTDAILEAAVELLLEVGYDRLRVQDVAERAGSGTGAIYRRWPNKEALVAEAIRQMPDEPAPVTDDPIADLRALVLEECLRKVERPDLVPGLIAAMRSDARIDDAVKSVYSQRNMLKAVGRVVGPDHPYLMLLAELAAALTLMRVTFRPEPLDPEATTDEIVSFIQSVASGAPPATD